MKERHLKIPKEIIEKENLKELLIKLGVDPDYPDFDSINKARELKKKN